VEKNYDICKKQWHAVVQVVNLLDRKCVRENHFLVTNNNGATAAYCDCNTIFNCYDLVLHATVFGLLVGLLLRIISRLSNHGNYYFFVRLFHRTSRTFSSFFNFKPTLVYCAMMTLYFSISLNNWNTSLLLCVSKYLCNIISPYLQKSLHFIIPPRFPSTNFAANEWHGCLY